MEENEHISYSTEVSFISYRSFVLQGSIAGSEFKQSKDPKYNGVCQVRVAGAEGGRDKSSGTGFLCKMNGRCGLLTCYHVLMDMCRESSEESEMSRITLKFPSIDVETRLTGILKANIAPIKDVFWDIYFAEISDEFKSIMEAKQVIFFETATSLDKTAMIWIPQFVAGKNYLQLTSGMFHSVSGLESILHKASTDTGSAGAPLLQLTGNELHVIGMHKGSSPRGINMAIHISRILQTIQTKAGAAAASSRSVQPIVKEINNCMQTIST